MAERTNVSVYNINENNKISKRGVQQLNKMSLERIYTCKWDYRKGNVEMSTNYKVCLSSHLKALVFYQVLNRAKVVSFPRSVVPLQCSCLSSTKKMNSPSLFSGECAPKNVCDFFPKKST
jgi:hypothetical protein